MDKPFKTIDQQVAILESRGLSCDSETSGVLRREGYYQVVNGYKEPFLLPGPQESYDHGCSFADVYTLFSFDRSLRMVLFEYFNKAEATLKTVVSYRFAEAHQDAPEAYLDRSAYRPDEALDDRIAALIGDFNRALSRGKSRMLGYRKPYIEHYERSHDSTPIWVLMNFLMMGQAFKFYEFLPESVQNAVAKTFSELYAESHPAAVRISPRRLRLAYNHIKDFRNICAHDERLYCARVSPAKDITFARMLDDLQLVLTDEDHKKLKKRITLLLTDLTAEIGPERTETVIAHMGLTGTEEAFYATLIQG